MMIRATPEGARDYLVPSRLQHGQLLRPAAVAAAVQAALHGGRAGPLLPDRPLHARRGPARRPSAGVHPARPRDVVRRRGGRLRGARTRHLHGLVGERFPRDHRHAVPAPDLARVRWTVSASTSRTCVSAWSCATSPEALRGSASGCSPTRSPRGGVVKGIAVPGGADLTRGRHRGPAPRRGTHLQGARPRLPLAARGQAGRAASPSSSAPRSSTPSARPRGAAVGDAVLMVADRAAVVAASLGALRNHLARERSLADPGRAGDDLGHRVPDVRARRETGEVTPLHHPFTMVHRDDVELLETDPLRIRSRAYDIVLNGREIGSGSIRITDPAIQAARLRGHGDRRGRRPSASSASCSRPSSTACRPMAASPPASSAW